MNNRQLKKELKKVHSLVFKNFEYQTDKEQYGVIEKWVEPDTSYNGRQKLVGDCEDFALHCRKLLREKGIKTRLVFCTVEDGSGHLVLEASGFILDNRETRVVTNAHLMRKGYTFLKISGFESGDPWYNLVKAAA